MKNFRLSVSQHVNCLSEPYSIGCTPSENATPECEKVMAQAQKNLEQASQSSYTQEGMLAGIASIVGLGFLMFYKRKQDRSEPEVKKQEKSLRKRKG